MSDPLPPFPLAIVHKLCSLQRAIGLTHTLGNTFTDPPSDHVLAGNPSAASAQELLDQLQSLIALEHAALKQVLVQQWATPILHPNDLSAVQDNLPEDTPLIVASALMEHGAPTSMDTPLFGSWQAWLLSQSVSFQSQALAKMVSHMVPHALEWITILSNHWSTHHSQPHVRQHTHPILSTWYQLVQAYARNIPTLPNTPSYETLCKALLPWLDINWHDAHIVALWDLTDARATATRLRTLWELDPAGLNQTLGLLAPLSQQQEVWLTRIRESNSSPNMFNNALPPKRWLEEVDHNQGLSGPFLQEWATIMDARSGTNTTWSSVLMSLLAEKSAQDIITASNVPDRARSKM